jgi:uncharacterized membrane protein
MKKASLITLYVTAIILGITFFSVQALSVRRLKHDDCVSYIAATGHQALYSKSQFKHQWVPAGDWQALWAPDEFGCFRTIARDLTTHDIHPPLYFWILHIWSFIFGLTLTSGPILNILFHFVACITVSATCRFLKCPLWIAGAVGLLWFFSCGNLSVVAEARQYSLLSATSALFIASLLHFSQKPSWTASCWLCLTTTLGMLTHYHFALLLALCCSITTLQALLSRQWRTVVMLTASLTLAGLIFFLLHPTFHLSIERQQMQAQVFEWTEVPMRLDRTIATTLELFIPHDIASRLANYTMHFWLPIAMVALITLAAFLLKSKHILRKTLLNCWMRPTSILPLGAILCFTAVIVLYISCSSPRHAMRVKYLMVISPLLFIILGQLIAVLNRKRHIWALAIVVGLLISQTTYGTMVTVQTLERARQPYTNPLKKQGAFLVLDSTSRGILPKVLWHADPAMPVFASPQKSILADGLPELPKQGIILYVSDHKYGNTDKGRESILSLFANHGYTVS